MCDNSTPLSGLSRSLLVLVVLAGLSKSLGLQALDQILVLPTELGRKITQSDEVAVRSIQLIIINYTVISKSYLRLVTR